MFDYVRNPAEITRRSFEIIAAEADFSGLPADIAPVAARIVHACGFDSIPHDLGAYYTLKALRERLTPEEKQRVMLGRTETRSNSEAGPTVLKA